jgi:hypothetical protein
MLQTLQGIRELAHHNNVVLLTLYAKAKTDNLTASKIKEIRNALED